MTSLSFVILLCLCDCVLLLLLVAFVANKDYIRQPKQI